MSHRTRTDRSLPLDLDAAAMRSLLESVASRLIPSVASISDQPLHRLTGGARLARSLREPVPESPSDPDDVLRLLFDRVIPVSLNAASGGFMAYVPGGGLFVSAVADFIALATNRYTGLWMSAPGLVRLEQNVIEWFCDLVGFGPGSGGLLTSGGSMATLIATITARRERLPENFLHGVVYTSDQAHHSVRKAALLAGFLPDRIRAIATDSRFRLDVTALSTAMSTDRENGLAPALVIASAGTTNTGAIDPISAIADLAHTHGAWLHVDAAYGGFFAMTDRGRQALSGINRADSITLDPHKGMFLPYGTGALVVRDRGALKRTHAVTGAYMPPAQTDEDHVDFCDLGPELTREARGLRVWLPLKLHGAKAFREALDEKITLARYAADALRATPDIDLVAEPELSLLAFRYRPKTITDEAVLESLNRELLRAVNSRQRAFLTGTHAHGMWLVRVCIVSFRTHHEHIDAMIEDLRAAVDSLRLRHAEAPAVLSQSPTETVV